MSETNRSNPLPGAAVRTEPEPEGTLDRDAHVRESLTFTAVPGNARFMLARLRKLAAEGAAPSSVITPPNPRKQR
jgi:hypothetical protein